MILAMTTAQNRTTDRASETATGSTGSDASWGPERAGQRLRQATTQAMRDFIGDVSLGDSRTLLTDSEQLWVLIVRRRLFLRTLANLCQHFASA
jgi:hypothetical protein